MAIRRWILFEVVLVLFAAVTPLLTQVQKRVQLETIPGNKTVVRGDRGIRKVDASVKEAALQPNEYVVVRWATKEVPISPIASRTGNAWSVSFGFIGIAPDGREIRFRPVIESAGGLAPTGNAGSFQGRIFVGLLDDKNPDATYPLPQPVSLLVSGQAEELMPRQFTMDHTNLPFTEITIASHNPPDPTEFTLIAAGTSERATINLAVVRPRLELSARSRIQGFGLETSSITVRAIGLPDPKGRLVTVTSDFGSVEPTQVALDAQGVGTTTLRSVSSGNASINAESPPMEPAHKSVYFSFPFTFLVATILGGLAGAGLERLQNPRRKKRLRNVLLRGVLAGLVIGVCYAVGVNLLPIHPTATAGEALTFAVAAVAGFVGLKL